MVHLSIFPLYSSTIHFLLLQRDSTGLEFLKAVDYYSDTAFSSWSLISNDVLYMVKVINGMHIYVFKHFG